MRTIKNLQQKRKPVGSIIDRDKLNKLSFYFESIIVHGFEKAYNGYLSKIIVYMQQNDIKVESNGMSCSEIFEKCFYGVHISRYKLNKTLTEIASLNLLEKVNGKYHLTSEGFLFAIYYVEKIDRNIKGQLSNMESIKTKFKII